MAGIKVKDIRFWAPIIFSIPLSVVCFIVAAASAGTGHGDGRPFVFLFPYFFVLFGLGDALKWTNQAFGLLGLILLALQFPLYGLVVAIASQKGKLIWAVTIMIVLRLSIAGHVIYDF